MIKTGRRRHTSHHYRGTLPRHERHPVADIPIGTRESLDDADVTEGMEIRGASETLIQQGAGVSCPVIEQCLSGQAVQRFV